MYMVWKLSNRRIATFIGSAFCFLMLVSVLLPAPLEAQVTPRSAHSFSSVSSVISRLTSRLKNRGMKLAAAHDLILSVANREDLLSREITLRFAISGDEGAPSVQDARLRLSDHPEWISINPDTGLFTLDERTVRQYFADEQDLLPRAVHAMAKDPEDNGYITRATVIGEPKGGFVINHADAARSIMMAVERKETSALINAVYESPRLFVVTPEGTKQYSMLSQGISDFKGSALGRQANVVKALQQQLRGVVIPEGEAFSFNKAVAGASGWSNAYVIANGELVLEPGGGICQAATTAFRAAVLAGLPIEKRANHSLYVTYYKAYGVGVDATVYAGKQDFTFRNDTKGEMIMLARAEGTKAIVELYGTPDGRSVAVEGPFFANADSALTGRVNPLRINQIGWTYDVTYPDGGVVRDEIVSTYKVLPKKLAAEYEGGRGIGELLGEFGTGSVVPMKVAQR